MSSWRKRRRSPTLKATSSPLLNQPVDGVPRNAEEPGELVHRHEWRPRLGVRCRAVSAHVRSVAVEPEPRINGDETFLRLDERCPAAFNRLEVFFYEWNSDRDAGYREWVRRERKPISQDTGVNTSGLLEAVEEVAAIVQRELHERPSPLTMTEAFELWHLRRTYLNALIHVGGNRLAKEVEAKASPDGQPLAICLGSTNLREQVVTVRGPMTMHGYGGCLRTFPDLPFGPGRRWPRLCPKCEPQRSNARKKAISELQRRAARQT